MTDTTAAPAPAAPTSSITQPTEGAEPTAKDIMSFDPFGPESAPKPETPAEGEGAAAGTTPGETGKPAEGEAAPQAGADGKPVTTPAQQPAAPATPAQGSPQPDLAAITQAIRDAVTKPAEGAPQSTQPAAPRYNLSLPPQILTALRSEDSAEFATGMHAVVNGIANKVWTDSQEFITKELLPQIGQLVQGHIQSAQQQAQVAQEFYGKHKTLAAPQLRPLVQQAGLAVAQRRAAANKPLNWSPELADEIAEEVYTVLPALRPQAASAPAPAGGKPNGRQPFSTGAGARPAAAGAPTPADEMVDLIKG